MYKWSCQSGIIVSISRWSCRQARHSQQLQQFLRQRRRERPARGREQLPVHQGSPPLLRPHHDGQLHQALLLRQAPQLSRLHGIQSDQPGVRQLCTPPRGPDHVLVLLPPNPLAHHQVRPEEERVLLVIQASANKGQKANEGEGSSAPL